MSSRRNLFAAAPALGLALAGCASLSTSTIQADTPKVEAYIQGGVTTIQAYLLAFGSLMSSATFTSATSALASLSTAATAVGTAIANASPTATTASAVQNVSSLLQLAIDAVVAGLSSIVSPGTAVVAAIGVAQEVATFLPVLAAFVQSVQGAVSARVGIPPAAATHLAIMIP